MKRKAVRLLAAIVITQIAGLTGAIFTSPAIPSWYENITKPSWVPPNWLFAPVWTALYLLMGVSLFLIWEKGNKNPWFKKALGIFLVQLILNIFWSILFFGMKNPGLALIEIIVLWLSILLMIIIFLRVSKVAAWIQAPYLLWVSFATLLNFSIYRLN